MKFTALILAAGKGTRMKSEKPKVLHELCGKPMVSHVIDFCKNAGVDNIVVIAGHKHTEVKKILSKEYKNIKYVLQQPQKGTAHAVSAVLNKKIPLNKGVVILSGDAPLVGAEVIRRLIKSFTQSGAGGIIGISKLENPHGYGRIIRDSRGYVAGITEEKDASAAVKKIIYVNGGVYIIEKKYLKEYVPRIKKNKRKGEYYLTDIAGMMSGDGIKIRAVEAGATVFSGVNDPAQLAEAAAIKNKKILEKLAKSGVKIEDFNTVFIDAGAKIGKGTVIKPFTIIKGNVKIGKNSSIGPAAHIRPETEIGDNCKIGNYVEIKKSKIGSNTNVAHLSYVGDSELGPGVNIGAGTITANYDGVKKNKTKIGADASVGSNVVFVAPVKIGKGALIGAGSVITKDVPAGKMAIARAKQAVKEKKVLKRRNKK